MMNLLPMCACSTRDLMIGRNPLYVAKQHGHSISTMLWVYAAWAEGTTEADVTAIRAAMAARPSSLTGSPNSDPTEDRRPIKSIEKLLGRQRKGCRATYGNRFAICPERASAKCLKGMAITWRRGWDSNPRAGITRPSDFESAPL